jgi:hypothetical protein
MSEKQIFLSHLNKRSRDFGSWCGEGALVIYLVRENKYIRVHKQKSDKRDLFRLEIISFVRGEKWRKKSPQTTASVGRDLWHNVNVKRAIK